MNIAPEINTDQLMLIAQGHCAFQLLWAGVEVGVFDLLSEQPDLTVEQLETKLGLAAYPHRVLLTGLAALGLITKSQGRFRNSTVADARLVKRRPDSLAHVLGWQADIVYPGLQDFHKSLRAGTNLGLEHFSGEGTTLYERLTSHPDLEHTFQQSMSALSAHANRHVIEGYDLGRFTHLVDMGGGDGTNAIALARRYPKLRLTVYDSASVCEIAQQKINAAGLADRIDTWVGNFHDDPVPPGVDAILFCHAMTMWSMERNLKLLRKCEQALPADGAVVFFNMMGDDDDTGPISTALGSPYFLAIATGEGMLHSWRDYEAALTTAGFSRIERVSGMPMNHGLIVAQR